MSKEITVTNNQNLYALIEKNPDLNPDTIHKLIDANERIMAKQAEIEFNSAMARLQPNLPQIEKTAKAHNSKYAKLEDIDLIVRPLYTGEGFSVSYDTKKNEDGTKTYFGTLSHASGHSKTIEMTLPDDGSGSKNAIQAVASTVSYAQRYLLKMLLNIVEKGEDNDGNGNDLSPIDDVQFKEIQRLIDDNEADTVAFCDFFKIKAVKELTNKQYPRAVNMLKAKKKVKK